MNIKKHAGHPSFIHHVQTSGETFRTFWIYTENKNKTLKKWVLMRDIRAATHRRLFGLKLFLPLQSILFDLSLSFFLRLLQTPVLTCRGRETPTERERERERHRYQVWMDTSEIWSLGDLNIVISRVLFRFLSAFLSGSRGCYHFIAPFSWGFVGLLGPNPISRVAELKQTL